MSYRSIVVHLDASERAEYRLDVALSVARPFRAHLNAVYAVFVPEARAFHLVAGSTVWFEEHEPRREDHRHSLEHLYHAGLARSELSGDWFEDRDQPAQAVARRARCADLVIAGQPDPNDPEAYVADHFAETLVMSSGRPVLLLPYAGVFANLGDNVLIGWDASREASRALYDALPFLQRARQVTIVSVNAKTGRVHGSRASGADIASTLARHDLRVTVRDIEARADVPAGNVLLSEAERTGANLLVMGGYGHAHWQEVLLGGATRTLLRSMTVPVLMSH
ncbi:universal stress protein [Caballeronia sp. RCC_10]|uniref:universal stress protein n=1 Tax=Caballeronia sp. RCC_10 TaxID=3239227 RepID=UPI0035232CAB